MRSRSSPTTQKTASAYGQLAFYLYADFQFKEGDAAAEQAVAASDPSDRKDVREEPRAIAEQAREQKKLADKAGRAGAGRGRPDAGEAQLNDPFGALGGRDSSPSGGPEPAPAPAPPGADPAAIGRRRSRRS